MLGRNRENDSCLDPIKTLLDTVYAREPPLPRKSRFGASHAPPCSIGLSVLAPSAALSVLRSSRISFKKSKGTSLDLHADCFSVWLL